MQTDLERPGQMYSNAQTMRLKDKVAIITGSAQGIGRAIAERYQKEGAKLILCDMREESVAQTAKELSSLGNPVTSVACNVTKKEDCEKVVNVAIEKHGQIDVLVNNAGITKDGLIMRMKEEDWDIVMDVNLKGAFHFVKACVSPMMKKRSGRIINISSVVGLMGNPGQANYAASKGGLIAFSKAMAKELATRNILVNAIAPGFVATQMTDALPEEVRKLYLSAISLGRFAQPDEIAKVALFLASDDSSYVTGQVISVNGGLYM